MYLGWGWWYSKKLKREMRPSRHFAVTYKGGGGVIVPPHLFFFFFFFLRAFRHWASIKL